MQCLGSHRDLHLIVRRLSHLFTLLQTSRSGTITSNTSEDAASFEQPYEMQSLALSLLPVMRLSLLVTCTQEIPVCRRKFAEGKHKDNGIMQHNDTLILLIEYIIY